MTMRKNKNILAFDRTGTRGGRDNAPALSPNTASGIDGLALVIHFPDRRRVTNLLQFPLRDRMGFAQILTVKSNDPDASLSGWPKITAIGRNPEPKPVIQAPEVHRAAADRQAMGSGEDEGTAADPD